MLKLPLVALGDWPAIKLFAASVQVGVKELPGLAPVWAAIAVTTLFTAAGALLTVSELGVLATIPNAL
jgi:hypothetical protein